MDPRIVTRLGLALAVAVFHMYILYAIIFSGLGLTVVLAESSLGIAVGSRYADFSEGPRPRFVTMTGSIIGSILGIIVMGLMVVAFVLTIILSIRLIGIEALLGPIQALPLLSSCLVGLTFSRIAYRLAIGPVKRILTEIPN